MIVTLSSPRPSNLNIVFHALADETRRGILGKLAEGPIKISDLAKPYAMSLPAVSKHIRVLEKAGLILRQVEGRSNICLLNPETLQDVESWLHAHRIFWQQSLLSFTNYVENKPNGTRKTNGKKRTEQK